jgi:hypothetical protein
MINCLHNPYSCFLVCDFVRQCKSIETMTAGRIVCASSANNAVDDDLAARIVQHTVVLQ